MHCPVTSSQRRVPQSQAARDKKEVCLEKQEPRSPRKAQANGGRAQQLCRELGCFPEAVSRLENATVSNSVFAPKGAK